MKFASDTTAPAHPKILEAMAKVNAHALASYGEDPVSAQAEQRLAEFFQTDLKMTIVASGTAANALSLALLCPPTGGMFCHAESHANCDERGAPEFFTHGGKLLTLRGAHGKIDRDELAKACAQIHEEFVHEVPAKALTVSNLTEAGTALTPEETAHYGKMAKDHDLGFHVDGARFCNALAHTGARPAELSWAAGADILSFGLGKAGALGAECIVLFGDMRERFAELEARRKRAGHMPPKHRFLAAQVLAMLEDDLCLDLARHANRQAAKLAQGLETAGYPLTHPVDGNEVFAQVPQNTIRHLQSQGVQFYAWPDGSCRFVTSWNTSDDEIAAFLALLTA